MSAAKKIKRTFQIVLVTPTQSIHAQEDWINHKGRYTGIGPMSAAKKAFSALLKKSGHPQLRTLVVTIKETTKGSLHKEYAYKINRTVDPRKVVVNGKEIEWKYKVVAQSLKKSKS